MENSIENIVTNNTKNNIVLKNEENKSLILSYKVYSIASDKQLTRIVKSIEKTVRTSLEYSKYIGLLKNELDLTNCSFLGNVNDDDVHIEFHHYPFTLYDIVETIIFSKLLAQEPFTTMSIAYEVINIHFENIVGLVPLSKTAHQLTHADKLFISSDQIFGNVNKFIERYKTALTKNKIKKINNIIKKTEEKKNDQMILFDVEKNETEYDNLK